VIGYKSQIYPYKILVVDDNKANRTFLIDILTPLGFEIAEASNGNIGLEANRQLHPDLIFIDLMMPEMDGLETIRIIRQDDKMLPIIAASVFDVNRQDCLMAGCNDFIDKPINNSKLLELLSKYLKLQWIYPNEASEEELPILSSEQITELSNLTMVGDITGVMEFAEQLKISDLQLENFANKIIHLANDLELEQLQEIARQFNESMKHKG